MKKPLVVIGSLLSLVLLVGVLWHIDWPIFAETLRRISWVWTLAALLATAAAISIRAVRWGLLAQYDTQLLPFWQATTLGFLGNQIYPARAGEVIRLFAVRRLGGVTIARAAPSAVLDRVCDVAVLGGAGLFVVMALRVEAVSARHFMILLGVVGVALAGAGFLLTSRSLMEKLVGRLAERFSERWRFGARQAYDETLLVLRGLLRVRELLRLVLLSMLISLSDFAIFWCLIRAMGWTLTDTAPVTLWVFTSAGAALPSAPGYAGVLQVACVAALSFYGIGTSEAIAFSVVLQLCTLFTVLALALPVLLHSHISLKAASENP